MAAESSFRHVASLPTPRNADAVAFCPYAGHESLLACGCYELDSAASPPVRHGRLTLYDVRRGALEEACAVEGAGILDCVWQPASAASGDAKLLAAATSACDARLYALRHDDGGGGGGGCCSLEEVSTMPCDEAGDACMSIDWSSAAAGAPRVAVSSTSGRLYVGELRAGGGLHLLCSWQAHELEGWAVAFDPHDPHTLYSGADDAVLKRWDLRAACSDAADDADGEAASAPAACATNRRSHGAGVCCISPSKRRAHLLATGSYDETARLWDARMLRAPLCEVACGGGVWRLKWHPQRDDLLLSACMHAGFAALRVDGHVDGGGGEGGGEAPVTLEVISRYEAHGMGSALGYGADWSWGQSPADEVAEAGAPAAAPSELLGSTCSFYDRALHLWALQPAARET